MKNESHTFNTEPLTLPAIYYAGRGGYAIEHKEGYIPLPNEGQVSQHLVAAGVPKESIAQTLCLIRTENYVAHIGPVAGHLPGIHIAPDSGMPFLVTSGPKIIHAEPGKWEFIRTFLSELLGGDDPDQLQAAVAWLRQARRNVVAGKRRPLPAAILVGPRNCGKSLFIELARLSLGGRQAPAFAALSGTTNFNGHTLGAELLTIDDEIASKDFRTRTALAQGIKKQLFAGSVSIEAKHRDPIAMRPVQAVIVAVNDEPEHLQVLPIFDDSVADKLSLFQCGQASLDGLDDRDAIGSRIRQELPAFAHYLDSTEHPDHLTDKRTGAAAWQSRGVLSALQAIAPEERFRELLAQCDAITMAISSTGFWRGSSAEIERLLLEGNVTRHAARSLLSFPTACGTFIGRLAAERRCKISKSLLHGVNQWRIEGLERFDEQAEMGWMGGPLS